MAAMWSSSVKHQRDLQGFLRVLSTASCEWVLIFFLLVDAVLSYLLSKFAQYCELQLPCLLCSRLGDKKLESYRELVCSNHRLELSSLVSCHIHGKLANIEGLCEDCLLSHATQDNSNSDLHRLVAARHGLDIGNGGLQSPVLKKDGDASPLGTKHCSCCGKPWRSRPNTQGLLQVNPFRTALSKPDIPFPSQAGQNCLNRQNGLKKLRNKIHGSPSHRRLGSNAFDPFLLGYSELKIAADSETDMLLSDNDDEDKNLVSDKTISKEKSPHKSSDVLPKTKPHSLATGRWSDQSQTHGSLLLDISSWPEASEHQKPLTSDVSIWHGLKELNWQQAHQKPNPGLSELMKVPVVEHRDSNLQSATAVPKSDQSKSGFAQRLQNGTGSSDGYKSEAAEPQVVVQSHGGTECLDAVIPHSLSSSHLDTSYVQPRDDEARVPDAPKSHNKTEVLQKSETESDVESHDDNIASEVEAGKLKQQLEYDQKSVAALYKELEEERSASAIAANQAMAMITRLQEEKAALHMEALQYLRMMEEQAEYDVEALQKANDLLAEKEKDIQDLEAELEYFKSQDSADLAEEKLDRQFSESVNDNFLHCNGGPTTYVPCDSIVPIEAAKAVFSTEFEEDKCYISESLKKLEAKLSQALNDGTTSCGTKTKHECKSPLHEGDEEGIDLVALKNEISELSDRLKAFEADFVFLKHTCHSLQNGVEGLHFIEEIAHHLQELREVGRCLPFPESAPTRETIITK